MQPTFDETYNCTNFCTNYSGTFLVNPSNAYLVSVSEFILSGSGIPRLEIYCTAPNFRSAVDRAEHTLTADSLSVLLRALSPPYCLLQTLVCDYLVVAKKVPVPKFAAEVIRTNRSIERLDIRGSNLGEEGLALVLSALSENPVLVELNISDNKLGDKGAEAVATFLHKNTTIQRLGLSQNSIGAHGFCVLFKVLEVHNRTLRSLVAYENNADDEAAPFLSRMIAFNNVVEELDLAENYLTDQVLALIANGVLKNEVLRRLDLELNHFSDSGGRVLAQMLRGNRGLTTLGLGRINMSEGVIMELAEALNSATCTVREVYVRESFSADGKETMEILQGAVRKTIVTEMRGIHC